MESQEAFRETELIIHDLCFVYRADMFCLGYRGLCPWKILDIYCAKSRVGNNHLSSHESRNGAAQAQLYACSLITIGEPFIISNQMQVTFSQKKLDHIDVPHPNLGGSFEYVVCHELKNLTRQKDENIRFVSWICYSLQYWWIQWHHFASHVQISCRRYSNRYQIKSRQPQPNTPMFVAVVRLELLNGKFWSTVSNFEG